MPISWDLSNDTQIAAYPTLSLLPSNQRRKLAYSGGIALNQNITERLGASVELFGLREYVAYQYIDQIYVDLSLSWIATPNLVYDINTNFGVNSNTPDIQVVAGITRRF